MMAKGKRMEPHQKVSLGLGVKFRKLELKSKGTIKLIGKIKNNTRAPQQGNKQTRMKKEA